MAKGAQIYGVDDRVRFVAADAERLSEFVEPQPYDLVYSFGVIHHSPHPNGFFDRCGLTSWLPGARSK